MQPFVHQDACPIGNGGGTCKTVRDVEKFIRTGIGAIEIGSITEEYRPGSTGDTAREGTGFTLNSLGLPNGGRKYYEEHLVEMISMIQGAGKKAIVNVAGFSMEEYGSLTKMAFEAGADFVVENYGCPNVWADKMQKAILSYNLIALEKTTIHVIKENRDKACEGRIGIKLSPINDPTHIDKIATFLNSFMALPLKEEMLGFIGFITTQNTIPNCYFEENETSFISVNDGLAGMGGKALFPQALGQIKQFRKLLHPDIKIIGVGGVSSGADMHKMIRCGANLVQVTSAVYFTERLTTLNDIGAEYFEIIEPAVNS